ncbi:hypothetical protein O6H91_20G056400 [Diphasiastrum complanatum]|uniref:Uncharacterized protein n=2 Tax=Diphasiastrum complanatum TaxID=34168 RepID=A0ACC2AQQ6_DIPCM|nr:hypothetical protein O6H91_20G056400 [Diphasiastrum complanatum]KAJ7519807.1 hypothetical protein O6H91_20G056400 [Diphasiastrum complanatum]
MDSGGVRRSNKGKNRVPLRALARVASVAVGVQFGWSLQLSLLTPYVQELGISHTFASYIWLCGPISGMLVQPIVGHYSDTWPGSWGRRRPFILSGAILVVAAVLLIGFSSDIGYILGDSSQTRIRAIIIFILGFWILDLANNTLQGPCRALLADFTGKDQRRTRRGNAYFSLFMAVGNVLGFAAGSFNNWPTIFPFTRTPACNLACANLKSAFLVDVVLLILTTLLSVTAAEEIPWSPDTKNSQYHSIAPSTPLLCNTPDAVLENGTEAESGKPNMGSLDTVQKNDDDADSDNEVALSEAFIWELFGTFKELPKPMWFLLLITALTWFAWFPFLLFDTDWMGREVYRGEPNKGRLQQQLYSAGVEMGAFGLMLNAVVLGVSSLFIEPLCRRVHTSYVWASANVLMAACFASTAVISLASKNSALHGHVQPPTSIKVASLVVFSILGAPLAVTYSVPYALTATFTSSAGGGQGLSMGVLNLAVVLPQMVVSVGSGPWDALFGGGNMPSFLFAAAAALTGGLLAMFLLPKTSSEQEFRGGGLVRTHSCPIP